MGSRAGGLCEGRAGGGPVVGLGATGHTKLTLHFKDLLALLKTSLGFRCTQRLMAPLCHLSLEVARAPRRVAKVTPAPIPCPCCLVLLPMRMGKRETPASLGCPFSSLRLPVFAGE